MSFGYNGRYSMRGGYLLYFFPGYEFRSANISEYGGSLCILAYKKAESEHKFVVFYVLSCFFLFICFWNTMCKSLALSLLYSLNCSWFHSSSALASWVLGYMPDWRMWVSCYIINLTIFSCISFKQFICSIKICLRFY